VADPETIVFLHTSNSALSKEISGKFSIMKTVQLNMPQNRFPLNLGTYKLHQSLSLKMFKNAQNGPFVKWLSHTKRDPLPPPHPQRQPAPSLRSGHRSLHTYKQILPFPPPTFTDKRFQSIESRLDASGARMDNIEELC